MREQNKVLMKERVMVAKFDKTEEDNPTEPFETVVQETVTEVSIEEAMALGFVPKSMQTEGTGQVIVQGEEHDDERKNAESV